eukprot:TRINITY_DN23020_c0_g1_i3.p1 TRINITY_DN23020_c0_g1~~TRINITY_DN23020_c0_g1_i3.p1  ORF type:complete len:144 (+),score=14.97 TRINITY_DN23020_c0_g1_i3:124-555(+)
MCIRDRSTSLLGEMFTPQRRGEPRAPAHGRVEKRARSVMHQYYTKNPHPSESQMPFPDVGRDHQLFDGVLSHTGDERTQLKRSFVDMSAACQTAPPEGYLITPGNANNTAHHASNTNRAPRQSQSASASNSDQEAFLHFVSQQ